MQTRGTNPSLYTNVKVKPAPKPKGKKGYRPVQADALLASLMDQCFTDRKRSGC